MTESPDRERQLVAPDIGVIDYQQNAAARCYFRARECASFYSSLKHVRPRREFHPTLRAACEEFLAVTLTEEDRRVVDGLMAAQQGVLGRSDYVEGQDTLDSARTLFPRACELLGLRAPLTVDSLRTNYREASKRHHPDRGGSHMDMVSITDAYPAIHALLCREIESGTPPDDGPPDEDGPRPSCAAYRWEIASILIRALVDDWSLADAFAWLEQLCSSKFTWPDAASGGMYWRVLRAADILVSRLTVAGLRADAERALELGHALARASGSADASLSLRGGEAAVRGTRRAGVSWLQISHPRQADNLLRLGVINEGRHRSLLRRLAKVDAVATATHKAYREAHRSLSTKVRQWVSEFSVAPPPSSLVRRPRSRSRLEAA